MNKRNIPDATRCNVDFCGCSLSDLARFPFVAASVAALFALRLGIFGLFVAIEKAIVTSD